MPPVFPFDCGYIFYCRPRPVFWSNVQHTKKQRLSVENSTLLNLKSCSFTPKFIFPVHDLIQSDVRGGIGNKETYFYWFPAQVPFSLLLVNFLAVWEIRFFPLFISKIWLFSACTFELLKQFHEKQCWFINQKQTEITATDCIPCTQHSKQTFVNNSNNKKWAWKMMRQWIVTFYLLFLHCEHDWNLALCINIAAFSLKEFIFIL